MRVLELQTKEGATVSKLSTIHGKPSLQKYLFRSFFEQIVLDIRLEKSPCLDVSLSRPRVLIGILDELIELEDTAWCAKDATERLDSVAFANLVG